MAFLTSKILTILRALIPFENSNSNYLGTYHIFFCFFIVIVDASDSCSSAIFAIGTDSSTTRQWDIKVTQYKCGDEDISGESGCLQYYTATSGNIAKYENFFKQNI